MTNTENTTRPSNNSITRRKMLQSVAVTSSLAIVASMAPSQSAVASEEGAKASAELLDLIRTHRAAWVSFSDSCNAADSMHPDYAGPEAEAIWEMLNDAEKEALQLVLAFPVRTMADAQAKASHLLQQDYGLDDDDFAELLGSIAQSRAAITSSFNVAPVGVPRDIDPVFSAIAALKAADRRALQSYGRLCDAESAAHPVHGHRPSELIAWRNYSHIGGSEIEDRKKLFLAQPCADAEQIEREYQDAKRRYRARQRQAKQWDQRAGVTSLRAQNDQARNEYWRTAETFSKTVPTTVRGVDAMLRLTTKELKWCDDAWMHRALRSATKGIHLLAKASA